MWKTKKRVLVNLIHPIEDLDTHIYIEPDYLDIELLIDTVGVRVRWVPEGGSRMEPTEAFYPHANVAAVESY